MSKGIKKQIEDTFENLKMEGFRVSLIDYSKESDDEVWVAYALNQNEEQVAKLKKDLAETGLLTEPADDLIEPIDELFSSLKAICQRTSA